MVLLQRKDLISTVCRKQIQKQKGKSTTAQTMARTHANQGAQDHIMHVG